jgi:hypothetical protein
MPFISKLVAIVLTLAFAANAQCAASCFSADTQTKTAHPCCDDKKPAGKANCANKIPASDYLLLKTVSHVQAPSLLAAASVVSPAPSSFIIVVRLPSEPSADPPDPARSITIRRI